MNGNAEPELNDSILLEDECEPLTDSPTDESMGVTTASGSWSCPNGSGSWTGTPSGGP